MRSTLRLVCASTAVAAMTIASDARAADDVPAPLVAELAMKVTSYDRNHAARSKARPRILVYENSTDDRSARAARLIAQTLRDPDIGRGAPVDVVPFTSAADLATGADARAASIIVLAPGLEEKVRGIAVSLAGKNLMTIGTNAALAEGGAVVGFELREGKPKIVVNVKAARAQNVELKAELLALARIVP